MVNQITTNTLLNTQIFIIAVQYLHNPLLMGKKGERQHSNEFTFEVHVPDEPELPRFRVLDAIDAHVDDGCPFLHHVSCDQTRNPFTTRTWKAQLNPLPLNYVLT